MYKTSHALVSFSINKSFDYSIPIVFSCIPQCVEQGVRKKESQKVITPKGEKKAPACTVASIKKLPVISKKTEEIIKKKEEPIKKIVESTKKIESLKKECNKDEMIKNASVPIKKAYDSMPAKNEIYTSSNHREVEARRCAAQLQKELVNYWHPPLGVSADCVCEVSFFVTSKGVIEQLKMVKSSGVMIFDISARQALLSMKMPPWTYNKHLNISFNQ